MAGPLALLLLAGCAALVWSENVSIQYVIIHTTSNATSVGSSRPSLNTTNEPLVSYASSPQPFFSVEQAVAVSSVAHGPSSASLPVTRTPSLPAFRNSEHFLAVTYEHQIPGMPGKDYPIHSSIPQNKFDCAQYEQNGYYADVISGCQVIHICQEDGTHESFLCPNGTIFNQQYLVCDWWFNVDCSKSWTYYSVNMNFQEQSNRKPDRQEDSTDQNVDSYEMGDHALEDSAEINEYAEDFEDGVHKNTEAKQ